MVDTVSGVGKAMVKDFVKPQAKVLGKGMLSGATMGVMGKDTAPDGSIFNEEGKVNTGDATTRKVGQAIGVMVPLIASEILAGAAMPYIIAKYGTDAVRTTLASGVLQKGFSPLKEAVVRGAGTMGLYNAAKGAAQNKPPAETI